MGKSWPHKLALFPLPVLFSSSCNTSHPGRALISEALNELAGPPSIHWGLWLFIGGAGIQRSNPISRKQHLVRQLLIWNKIEIMRQNTKFIPKGCPKRCPKTKSLFELLNSAPIKVACLNPLYNPAIIGKQPTGTLLQYHYLMSHFAYRFWVLKTWPVCLMRQHCVAFKEEHSPIHFWED